MKKTSEPAIGIDLGTTLSVVAHLDDKGWPRTILNAEGDLTTPSVVYFHESGVVVGKEAVKVAAFEPDAVAQCAKRDMGRLTFHKAIRGQRLPPEVVEAFVLRKLKQDASLKLGDFRKAVITVPAFFNEPRRKATMDAGLLAGIDVLDIINEPTAAALSYGVEEGFLDVRGGAPQPETVLVYDLGGGTFDVTLMRIDGRRYHALATAGDVHLGGIDWDRRIVDHLAGVFQEEHGVDPRLDPESLQMLLQEAEDAKRALTSRSEVTVRFAHQGQRIHLEFTREQFEGLSGDLLQRTIFTTNKLLGDAGVAWDEVSRLLLVGGSSRMPMVQEALERESGMHVDRSLSPDEAVAHGAALYAGFLLHEDEAGRPQLAIQNVNSHDLGVLGIERATGCARRQVLINRNTPLPASGGGKFVTHRDNQSSVAVKVVEGGDASGKHSTLIGKCVVADLPAGLPAMTPVHVRFDYASNGRLKVAAKLPGTGHRTSLTVERASGLSEESLTTWAGYVEQGSIPGMEAPADVVEVDVAEDGAPFVELVDVEDTGGPDTGDIAPPPADQDSWDDWDGTVEVPDNLEDVQELPEAEEVPDDDQWLDVESFGDKSGEQDGDLNDFLKGL